MRLLLEELERERIHVPVRTLESGRQVGGTPFLRLQLRLILKNRHYIGEIPYKGEIYLGLHPPIIDRDLWDQVQAKLAAHPHGGERSSYAGSRSLFAGKLFDEGGERLIATHASRLDPRGGEGRRRFSYYVSKAGQLGAGRGATRIPAREIEGAVIETLAQAFADPLTLMEQPALTVAVADIDGFSVNAVALAARVRAEDRELIQRLITRIYVLPAAIAIECDAAVLAELTGARVTDHQQPIIRLHQPMALTRSGRTMRMIQGGQAIAAAQDATLVRLLAKARTYWQELRKGEINVTELAAQESVSPAYVTRVLRLAFLSPTVVEAILAGRQPSGLNRDALLLGDQIDGSWSVQAQTLLKRVAA